MEPRVGANGTQDRLFGEIDRVEDFCFDHQVAAVFDDMISRSVPFYEEVQRMVVELGMKFLEGGGKVYDVGCATGTTLAKLEALVPSAWNVELVGIEPSRAMLEQARSKLGDSTAGRVQLVEASIQDLSELPDARLVTMLYTLQFVRPIDRLSVLTMIRRSLRPGGCLLVAEKVLADADFARRLYIDVYHDYKRTNGYSETEITKKRQALENVLIPYRNHENVELLRAAGFSGVEQAFRWYNFALYLAVTPD
jgi:tRNA (cmo5U34)-methyltransferase